MEKLSKENRGYFETALLFVLPSGDTILHNFNDGSCIVKTSDFVTTYTKEEMKEIYNYPIKTKL